MSIALEGKVSAWVAFVQAAKMKAKSVHIPRRICQKGCLGENEAFMWAAQNCPFLETEVKSGNKGGNVKYVSGI